MPWQVLEFRPNTPGSTTGTLTAHETGTGFLYEGLVDAASPAGRLAYKTAAVAEFTAYQTAKSSTDNVVTQMNTRLNS